MQARASASEVNHEAFNSSCRSLALNASKRLHLDVVQSTYLMGQADRAFS